MIRVCRSGGRVVLADIVPLGDQPPADAIERRRDPSHVAFLSLATITGHLERAHARVVHVEQQDQERSVDQWLDQSSTPQAAADDVRARLRAELGGGQPSGLHPRAAEDELRFVQRWAIVVATPTR